MSNFSLSLRGTDRGPTGLLDISAELFSGLNNTRQHECLRFADHVSDGGRIREDFNGERSAGSIGARNELLGNNAAKGFADHDANLVALIGREDIQESVERARGITRVKRA